MVEVGLLAMDLVYWFVVIGVSIFILALVGLGTYKYLIWKRYRKYKALIFKRKKDDKGRETIVFVGMDNGAIIKDRKLKKWAFHLKHTNIDLGEEESTEEGDENRELDIPSVPSEQGGELVFIEKLGPRKFAVGLPVLINGKIEVKVSEADIAEALRVYDVNARYFNKDKNALIAFAIYTIFAVLIMILVIYILNKFEILADVANKLNEAAQAIAQSKQAAVPSTTAG